MKISKLEEQSLRLTACLAIKGKQMTLPELAGHERLSEALVAKVMRLLRRGGVVNAVRGRDGGYELARPPESLTVAAILRSLGRPLFEGCFNSGLTTPEDPCPHVSDCGLRPIWEHLSAEVTRVLDNITLAELVKEERDVRAQLAVLLSK